MRTLIPPAAVLALALSAAPAHAGDPIMPLGEVRALSGQDRVPLAVVAGEAICDSRRIVEHLRWRVARGD